MSLSLLAPAAGTVQAISSVEIARVTKKEHFNVLRDIKVTLEAANIDALKFEGIYEDAYGREKPCYYLPKFELDLVVSGYSVPYRAAIIKRWHELEAKKAAPVHQIPSKLSEALQLAADQARLIEAKDAQLEAAAPKLLTYERCMSSDSLFGFREVAAILAQKGIGSTNLVRRLEEKGVLYHEQRGKKKGHVMAKAEYIHRGYFKAIERSYEVMEVGNIPTGEHRVSATLKVTTAGIEFIAKILVERREA